MCRTIIGLLLVASAFPALAQRGGGFGDRLARTPQMSAQERRILAVDGATPETTNAYAKVAAVYSEDADRSVSPSAIVGIEHQEPVHPWWLEGGYRYRSGDDDNRNSLSASGNYQLWTGSGSRQPYLQFETDYANRLNVAQRIDSYFDLGVTFGPLSFDVLGGASLAAAEDADTTTDFVPALSAMYGFAKSSSLAADYVAKNDVDGEDSFDIGVRQKFSRGWSVDVVAYKHGDIRVRVRKNFSTFRNARR